MAALAGGVLQTTFAAISFAGAGFLFSKMNHSGYSEEMKRHNKALEKLTMAKEAFYENEIKNKDRMAELRKQLSDANEDINNTNDALREIGRLEKYTTADDRTFNRRPVLNDFYRPSEEMKKWENITGIVMGTAVGFLADKGISMIL